MFGLYHICLGCQCRENFVTFSYTLLFFGFAILLLGEASSKASDSISSAGQIDRQTKPITGSALRMLRRADNIALSHPQWLRNGMIILLLWQWTLLFKYFRKSI